MNQILVFKKQNFEKIVRFEQETWTIFKLFFYVFFTEFYFEKHFRILNFSERYLQIMVRRQLELVECLSGFYCTLDSFEFYKS